MPEPLARGPTRCRRPGTRTHCPATCRARGSTGNSRIRQTRRKGLAKIQKSVGERRTFPASQNAPRYAASPPSTMPSTRSRCDPLAQRGARPGRAGSSSAAAIAAASAARHPAAPGRLPAARRSPECRRRRGDDRHAGGGRFQHHVGQRIRRARAPPACAQGERLARRAVADEADLVGDFEPLRLCLERSAFRPLTGDGCGVPGGRSREQRHRVDEDIDRLHRPQFTDADDIRGVGAKRNRRELSIADAVVDDANHRRGPAHLRAEQAGGIAAFEQEEVGAPLQQPLQGAIEAAR